MRFLKREGKKCSADEGTVEKGTLGLVDLGWMELDWTGHRAGQDRTIAPAGPSQGAKGAGCSRVEIVWGLREMRTGGSEARYPGIEVSRFPGSLRAGARTSERQCHTVRSVAASGTKWSEVALKVGMRFQDRSVQQAVRWGLPKSFFPRGRGSPQEAPKAEGWGRGGRGEEEGWTRARRTATDRHDAHAKQPTVWLGWLARGLGRSKVIGIPTWLLPSLAAP